MSTTTTTQATTTNQPQEHTMTTFTTVDIAIEAHYKTGVTVEQAHGAIITYIAQIEELDGRTIDQDNITLEDADFLVESVHSANASGDLN